MEFVTQFLRLIDALNTRGVKYVVIGGSPPGEPFFIDIITKLGEIDFSAVESEKVVVQNVHVTVATPNALYRMKRNTVREIDALDSRRLLAAYNMDDIDD